MGRYGGQLLGATLALAALVAPVSCRRGAEQDQKAPGAGAATPSTVVPQQAGGDTAWLRTSSGGTFESARAVGAVTDGRAVAAVTQQRADLPDAAVLLSVDATGALAWSRSLESACGVGIVPRGTAGG